MNTLIITADLMREFKKYLVLDEKSEMTVDKYMRDVRYFGEFAGGCEITKETVISYKNHLIEKGYAVSSINSMISSINSFLSFAGKGECKVKILRQQHRIYLPAEKELSKEEYFRLLKASETDKRLNLILQSICSTGIRVSELKFFTVEGISSGELCISLKGKIRNILIPTRLRKLLLEYARELKISSGQIFTGKNGKPLNRTCIWAMMKAVCKKAGVEAAKVFPHNLRKLFARTFYVKENNIALLADVLGHSSINTTRIYIMSSGSTHRTRLEKMGLVL